MENDECNPDETMGKKLRCVSLLLDCPINRNSPDCPFQRVRQEESVATRVNWIKSLNDKRLAELLDKHQRCLAKVDFRQNIKPSKPHPVQPG